MILTPCIHFLGPCILPTRGSPDPKKYPRYRYTGYTVIHRIHGVKVETLAEGTQESEI